MISRAILLQICLFGLLTTLFPANRVLAQGGPALVELAPIAKREIAETQTFVATVMPSKRVVVGSAVDGRVVEFPVNAGDRVEEQQPLAQLLTETISLELEAAQAELTLRKNELEELKNGSRPDEIVQARSLMEAARAAKDYRDSQRERMVSLFQQGRAATNQQVDEATSLALEAHETFQEASAAYRLIVEGPRPEKIAQAQARRAMQQAVVEKLADQLTKHTVISRFDGYVIAEHTEIGAWVSQGDPVAEVIALDEVDVEANVVERHVPFVHLGATVAVTVPAVSAEPFQGEVVSIVPQADVRSRTFPVKIRVENVIDEQGRPLLKAGMLARVSLPTSAASESLLVPKDSLVLAGQQAAVWVVDPASATSEEGSPMLTAPARQVPVKRGLEEGNLIQVIGDLKSSESVVVLGNERIIPSRSGEPTLVQWNPESR